MKTLDVYKNKVTQLDRELKSILSAQTINSPAIQALQIKLDNLSDEYRNEDLGIYLYKLYEIQAYLHFVRDELGKAMQFLEEAIRIRGHSYADAEHLAVAINTRKTNRDQLVLAAVRQKAKRQIAIGGAWLAIGLIVSGIWYVIAQHNAEQQAIASGQTSYSFSYFAMGGAIIVGGFQMLRGIFDLANASRKSQQVITTMDGV